MLQVRRIRARTGSPLRSTHAIPDWHLAVHEDKIVRRLRARNSLEARPAILSQVDSDAQGTTKALGNQTVNTIVLNDH